MLVIKQKMIYREDIKLNPDILYIFGDNLDREGFGGQAREMRGEPNSFGIATKRSISHVFPEDYFFDGVEVMTILKEEFARLEDQLQNETIEHVSNSGPIGIYYTKRWKAVVVPSEGLGTGLARLSENAPLALKYIEQRIKDLKLL